MGAYLSKPITEKISSDESNETLMCGASSMQGWRIYQEDAHNTYLNFDKNRSLFAVYDGHGGSEVAAYTATELPDFIKKVDAYAKEEFSQALIDAFLEFDATLVEPEVLAILNEISGTKDKDDSDYDGEEVNHLRREASMPLEEVMAKYSEDSNHCPPNIRPKEDDGISSASVGCSTSSLAKEIDESFEADDEKKLLDSTPNKINDSTESNESLEGDNASASPKHTCSHIEESSSSLCNGTSVEPKDEEKPTSEDSAEIINGEEKSSQINGKIKDEGGGSPSCDKAEEKDEEEEKEKEDVIVKSPTKMEAEDTEQESKELNGKSPKNKDSLGKGKGKSKGKGLLSNAILQAMRVVQRNEKKRKAAEKAEQIYKQIQEGGSDSGSDDDDDDENFENEKCCHKYDDLSSSSSDDDESDNDEDDDEGDDENENSEDNQYHEFSMNMKEEPGYDSGCTACVAMLNGRELFVANVGDSRCVVSRNGNALDMSVDHKPEDEPEAARIVQAGGRITGDGRVNGGLNLSRALGDHSYKQNKNQRPEEQMISPLPDIRSLTLTPEDSFMVIACDGIWNSMTSQEVCDFINERIDSQPKLSKIAEEIFDHCLSPDAHGDGTGCDNMTCIIVKFKGLSWRTSEGGKRPCEASEEEKESDPQEKRCRLEVE